ncbi:unnamed protein product [Peniophora sp. CBMAI 1063]|nr:unnamed protein product [Peniophora sp. CBMAI 1063]
MSQAETPAANKGAKSAHRGQGRPRGRGGKPRTESTQAHNKPPLTHFIALPIGHHADLRTKISAFTSALTSANPAISGLDPSIIISPRRLHLTLGVMSLDQPSPSTPPPSTQSQSTEPPPATLTRATELLHTLRPRVLEMLGGEPLRVGLERMDIMPPERGDPERAHVLWVGPDLEGEDGRRLRAVCDVIQKTFMDAGLVVDERRELKLHCTVVNTTYRKPRTRGPRIPFSYQSIRTSEAISSILATQPSAAQADAVAQLADATQVLRLQDTDAASSAPDGDQSQPRRRREKPKPLNVNLGSWSVDEMQICRMGSYGPEGEYVAEARCSITP